VSIEEQKPVSYEC